MAVQIKRLAFRDVVAGTIPAQNVTYDNGTSGLTATDVQAAIDELASLSSSTQYVQNFVIADWNLNAPNYTLTIAESTHGNGQNPNVKVYEGTGPFNEVTTNIEITASGNVTIKINQIPDSRFNGKIVIGRV